MAIQTMTIGEALDKGYGDFIIGAPQAQRSEATFGETATSIGLEVIPALIGGIGFGLAGGAGGSAFGNYLSQKYRMSRGLQDEFGLGEFGAATALGGVPVGRFANVGMAGKTAIRAGQGAALATGELTARTFIDEDRAPTPDEVATTLLFGGVFGGTLGAAEAKFLRDGTGADVVEGMTRPQVKDAIASNIKDKGGIENASVGSPLLSQMNFSQLINKKNSDEVTAEVMQGIENKLLQETEQVVQEIDLPDDASPLLNQLLPNLQDRNQARQNLRNAFNRHLQQSDEIFSETNPIVAKGNLADTQRLREIDEELKKLDHFGDGKQGDIALGLRRPPTVDPNLTKLSDDAFDAIEIKTRKKLDKLEDNFFNQGGMEQNNLGLKRKLAAAQDDYSAIELEKFRRQIAGEEPWFIASEFRILAGGTQDAETVFKLALLADVVKKRGIQQELFDELNANVGKDINAQEVFADQINKAKLAMQKFKGNFGDGGSRDEPPFLELQSGLEEAAVGFSEDQLQTLDKVNQLLDAGETQFALDLVKGLDDPKLIQELYYRTDDVLNYLFSQDSTQFGAGIPGWFDEGSESLLQALSGKTREEAIDIIKGAKESFEDVLKNKNIPLKQRTGLDISDEAREIVQREFESNPEGFRKEFIDSETGELNWDELVSIGLLGYEDINTVRLKKDIIGEPKFTKELPFFEREDEPPFLELQSIFKLSIKEARELGNKGVDFVKKALDEKIETLEKSLAVQESIAKGETPKLDKGWELVDGTFRKKTGVKPVDDVLEEIRQEELSLDQDQALSNSKKIKEELRKAKDYKDVIEKQGLKELPSLDELTSLQKELDQDKTPSNALRKKLEKEKRALERKHNIVGNVLLGGAGVASVASMLTEEEENELSRAGFDKIIIAGLAALGVGSKLKNKDLIKSAVKGRKQGISEQEQNIVEPERVGKAAVEAESTDKKRILIKDNVRSYYVDELIDSLKIADENNAAIILEELARRSALNTPEAQKIRKKMQIAAMEGDIDAPRSQQLSDPYSIPATGDPSAQGFRDLNKFQLVELARQGDQRAIAEIVRRAEKNPRTKRFFQREGIITGLLTTGTGAIALMEMMEDEDSSVSRAALGGGGLLVALAAAFGGYQFAKKFIKSAEFKKAKAQIKSNPSAAEPDIIKQAKINQVLDRNAFAPRNAVIEMMQSAMDFVSNALVPLSRKLKNINPRLTEVFRNHERQIAKRAREYMDRVSPFIVSMNKRLKNSPQKNRLFKQYLLNGEYAKIRDDILGPNAPQALFDELDEMTRTLDEIRDYARQRGGLDVGYIAQYFPRKIRNYTSFRRALEQQEDLGEIRTELDKALDDYAKKYGFADRDLIPPEEAAEVVSRALRTPPSGGMTPGNVKMRTIESVSPQMLDAYADPADALQDYVQRMVQATERRNFLLRKPDAGASKVGFEGSQDTINADLGMRMEVTDDMIGSLADRLRRENNLSQEDVEKLKEILRARFSSKTVSPFFQGMKNLNYMAVMGNFGSAITQLGDLAYSIHFNGFDNTFKALFNRKDNFNFVKYFGLSDSSIDAVTSTQGLSSALDKVFTVTGLKKLDQLGKNTFMNASWRKYHNQAKKNGTALVDDLAPVFGRERAGRMVRELQESDPKSNNLPKAVEELIWYKFLDINPATLGEMPKYYNESGNMRIAYMLKSFTLKQFDVFREAGIEDIRKATKLYSEGKKGEAAKFASKGMKKLLGLAVVFAAANASTDMIKDIMYGRPIKEDDLVLDNALKLVGINRYLMYKARREGAGKAVLETMLPPMTVFDRISKDLDDFLSGKEYKGNLLQGTPLDIIYWRYLGGVDKVRNMD